LLEQCGSTPQDVPAEELSRLTQGSFRRKYHRSEKARRPRTYRTRPDPFAGEWDEIAALLASTPDHTAKSLFMELRQRDPVRHPLGQLRTFQRRVAAWRAQAILEFTDE
jgi:hypothetical protein